jgi:aryl-alcohol dehydrogenase-like predicted oxidoreductase
MIYQTIPNTEVNVSAISLGSTGIGSTIDVDASFALLDRYADAGGNFIDTAAVYANWLPGERNVSEKTIGRWLNGRGNRGEMVLATKGAHPELETMHISRMSRGEIESDLNDSLRNLRTDVIDLYLLHRDDTSRTVEEILTVMNDQVKAGKIRTFGCSNWRVERIREAQEWADDHGVDGFVANQINWSLAEIDPECMGDRTTVAMDDELFDYHQTSGLAAMAYSSQAGGLFQKLARGDAAIGGAYPLESNQRRLKRIERLGQETGLSITQIVLAYLQSQPFVTVPVVGCRTLGQLNDSLGAADTVLSEDQIELLVAETL